MGFTGFSLFGNGFIWTNEFRGVMGTFSTGYLLTGVWSPAPVLSVQGFGVFWVV